MSELSMCPITLEGTSIDKKREEIKEYFLNTYNLYEKMFEVLKSDDIFYTKSEATRHPMIFYFGHTATFYVNKLLNMKIIQERINPKFESIFAVGVDEMTWDDVDSSHYTWPSVEETRAYRQDVKEMVLKLIEELPLALPITWNSEMWIILMGIEHEKIHLETSSVLHRQMPLECVKSVSDFTFYQDDRQAPKNELLDVPASSVALGKTLSDSYYGWDNEYGEELHELNAFKVSKYLVSNEEYLEFVLDDGYEKLEYWDDEGKEFLKISKAKCPVFWIPINGVYEYRTLTSQIKMPQNFPVEVNALEAEAFCRYKSNKDNTQYLLPSEAEYEAICDAVKVGEVIATEEANINFQYASSTPIDKYNFNGIYDVIGNVWQHSRSLMHPFNGFEVHPAYDDFTVPTFDDKHSLILGSSWASTGNLMLRKSRYAFRKHFYQHAGFRYVLTQQKEEKKMDIYETDELVSQYCEFQYGDENFGVKNFAVECARIASKYSSNKTKALDLGCATGRATFELAKDFDSVEGIDFSARFVQVGAKLCENGYVAFSSKEEGEIVSHKKVSIEELGYENLQNKVAFFQGDACNMKPQHHSYDLVIATNLIDRLYQPRLFLDTIDEKINEEGVLVITSPYTWQESSTDKEFWLGGYTNEDGKEIKTIDSLKEVLSDKFELVHLQDLDFVIKETARKYQHTISQLSVWKKR